MGALKSFRDGFLEKVRPENVPADVMDGTLLTPGTTGDPGDMSDYASLDMVEASVADDSGLPRTDLESEPLRLLNGALDFLGDVVEDGIEAIVANEQGAGQARPVGKPAPIVVEAATIGCEDWRAKVFNVTAANGDTQIVSRNPARREIRIVNLGPGTVFVGPYTRAGSSDPSGRMSVPLSKVDGTGAYSPFVIQTTNEVWATSGTNAIVEVMEWVGIPDNY